MKQCLAALGFFVVGIHMVFLARADIRPEQAQIALAAIEDARVLARAARGQLLLVGSALSTEQAPSENLVVVLDDPVVRDMKPGMILILARNGCEPIESCLIARRVREIDVGGEVHTEPYTAEGLLFSTVQATLLGSVCYAIDLATDSIRDMRAGRAQESITLARALAQQEAVNRTRTN